MISHIDNSCSRLKKSIKKRKTRRGCSSHHSPREKAQVCLKGDNIISLCVLGSPNVGKTSIVRRIMGYGFTEQYSPTVYESYVKHTAIEGDDVIIDLQDMSGSLNFPAMQKRAVDNAKIIIVVFGLDDFGSCQHAVNISVEFEGNGCGIPVIIIGNKSDIFKGKLENKTKIEEFMTNSVKRRYMEMSAKHDHNPESLIKLIYEEYQISRGPYRITMANGGIFKNMFKKSS